MTPELFQLDADLRKLLPDGEVALAQVALRHFAGRGGSRAEAITVIEKLRHVKEINEDDVLNLLDVASGWCSPQSRIWTSQ